MHIYNPDTINHEWICINNYPLSYKIKYIDRLNAEDSRLDIFICKNCKITKAIEIDDIHGRVFIRSESLWIDKETFENNYYTCSISNMVQALS